MKRVTRATAISEITARPLEREAEIKRLHDLLPSLGDEEIIAVYFRFWESLLIEDIAKILGRSWDDTDQLIERSIRKLRRGFFELPDAWQSIAA